MSVALKLEMPDDVFSALHKSPDEFGREMRIAAAVIQNPTDLIFSELLCEKPPCVLQF